MMFSLKKQESLKNKKRISLLFNEGRTVKSFPIMIKYLERIGDPELPQVRFVFTVPKRNIRKAVDRNKVKRRMREVVRLNKPELIQFTKEKDRQYDVALIYMAKNVISYREIYASYVKAFQKMKSSNSSKQ